MSSDIRISKDEYYLNIAKEVATRGTCLRRNYGAVIVKNDEIVSTGYTGAPRGRINCNALGKCIRMEQKVPSGQRYELCRSVHAEQNAIISCSRDKMIGATLYLYGWDVENNSVKKFPKPCTLCERMIINAGIKEVITYGENNEIVCYDVKTEYVDKDNSLPNNLPDIGTDYDPESDYNDDAFLRKQEKQLGIYLGREIDSEEFARFAYLLHGIDSKIDPENDLKDIITFEIPIYGGKYKAKHYNIKKVVPGGNYYNKLEQKKRDKYFNCDED